MIARELLNDWLWRGLCFANLQPHFSKSDAERALRGIDLAFPHNDDHVVADLDDYGPWYGPVDDYGSLHRDWVKFLNRLIEKTTETKTRVSRTTGLLIERRVARPVDASRDPRDPELLALHKWCEDRCESNFGKPFFLMQSGDALSLKFDDEGRPQGYLHACRPEGLLALVGAELIAPGAAYGVRQCPAPLDAGSLCNRFFKVPLTQVRGKGGPPRYCDPCRQKTAGVRTHRDRRKRKQAKKR